jgi:hypothetical protein
MLRRGINTLSEQTGVCKKGWYVGLWTWLEVEHVQDVGERHGQTGKRVNIRRLGL